MSKHNNYVSNLSGLCFAIKIFESLQICMQYKIHEKIHVYYAKLCKMNGRIA